MQKLDEQVYVSLFLAAKLPIVAACQAGFELATSRFEGQLATLRHVPLCRRIKLGLA